jgi:calcineurin-like phosphoesterase
VRKDEPIQKFLTQLPSKFEVAKKDIRLNGAVISVDEITGRALSIERVNVACG